MSWQWLSQHGTLLSNLINYIPVVATVVTCILSLVLARATLRYVEATDKGLALAREEFEREWAPELHIKLERRSVSEAQIIVTNLARVSVLLQLVQFRKITHAVPFERDTINEPVVGGTTWMADVSSRLLACAGTSFEGPVGVSVAFYASGRLFRTDWFRFEVEVRHGDILRIDPMGIPARRVHVLETAGPEEGLVRDVAEPVIVQQPN